MNWYQLCYISLSYTLVVSHHQHEFGTTALPSSFQIDWYRNWQQKRWIWTRPLGLNLLIEFVIPFSRWLLLEYTSGMKDDLYVPVDLDDPLFRLKGKGDSSHLYWSTKRIPTYKETNQSWITAFSTPIFPRLWRPELSGASPSTARPARRRTWSSTWLIRMCEHCPSQIRIYVVDTRKP